MSEAERACRYCLSGEGGELVAPCDCRGTSRWVHVDCLLRWHRMGGSLKECTECKGLYRDSGSYRVHRGAAPRIPASHSIVAMLTLNSILG